MKITWFGGTIFRLYVGGKIVVVDGQKSSDVEVGAAADHTIDLQNGLSALDAFEPSVPSRKVRRSLLEEADAPVLKLQHIDNAALRLSESGEDDVVLATGLVPWGRFADGGVIILAGHADAMMDAAENLFSAARPRLLALAVSDLDDAQFGHLAQICGDCAVQVLEPGLALEA